MKLSGIKVIDEQHIGLLQTLADAKAAIKSGQEFKALLTLLGKLSDYAVDHFYTEEGIMRGQNYFDLENQLREHKGFTKKIEEFTQKLTHDGNASAEMLAFAESWLVHHIEVESDLFREHLSERRIK